MTISRAIRSARATAAAALVGLALVASLATACSSKNADVSCSGSSCTATFSRNADSEVNVLGVKIQLVDVQNDKAQLKVGGQTIDIPVGQKQEVLNGTFTIELQQVNQNDVVVKVSKK